MKKRINLKISFLLLLAVYCLSGCTDDNIVSRNDFVNGRIVLNLPEEMIVGIQTRAIDENVVKEVLAVVIRNGVAKYEVVNTITQDATTISLEIQKISPQAGEDLYVFCNTGITAVSATNENELLEQITYTNTTTDALMMYGKFSITDVENISVSLKRASAKATLTAADNLTITGWKVCNVPTKGYIAKDNGYPVGVAFTDEVVPDGNGNAYFIPRTDHSTTTDAFTCLLVEVADKGWYRLDFYNGNNGLDIAQKFTPINVAANTWYQFNIQAVTGSGYDSPEEALANTGNNVVYNMLVSEGHAYSNGQYSLLADLDQITLYPVGGTGQNSLLVLNLSALIPEQSVNNITTYKVTLVSPSKQIKLKDGVTSSTDETVMTRDLYEGVPLTTENSKRPITLLFDGADIASSYLIVQLGNITKQIPIGIISSNCYLFDFSSGKTLYIPIIQANLDGKERIGKDIDIAPQVLWSDQSNVNLQMDYKPDKQWIEVTSTGGAFTGNVVIAAVEKGTNNIKWSWHIWALDGSVIQYDAFKGVYDFLPSLIQNYNSYAWMDRNLGAYSLETGQSSSWGLVYQWGRKDPFPGGTTDDAEVEPLLYTPTGNYKMTDNHPISGKYIEDAVTPGADGNNLEYSIANPNRFLGGHYYDISVSAVDFDWYTDDVSKRNNYLWISEDNKKMPFNPCPIGWTLPNGGMGSPWLTLWPTDAGVIVNTDGITWKNKSYYPFCPMRQVDGTLMTYTNGVNACAQFWWGNSDNDASSATYMMKTSMAYADSGFRSNGMSLRCVREK